MRDKKRIKRMLKLIEKIWLKNPDLRLLQLMGNSIELGGYAYYQEDNILEECLKYTYKIKEKKK